MKYGWFIVYALLMGAPVASFALSTPEGLYSVDVSVENQTTLERQRAARVGLLGVLTRVTGLTSIPRTAEVKAALANTTRFYDEFVFVDDEAKAGGAMALRISYQRQAILDLVRNAQLPIWWTRRPKVMAWIVVEELDERTIIDANSDHPLKVAIQEAAQRRGLEIELPLMDLEDHLKVNAIDIWGHSSHALEAAAEKYGANLNLVGRVSTSLSFRGRAIEGDWTYWLDDERKSRAFATDKYEELAEGAITDMAAELMARNSVPALGSKRWELRISGLRGGRPYADMMSYLAGLDFVERVALKALQADVATVVLDSSAQADQLLRLLVVEDRLAEDSLYLGSGVQLLWRG